MSLSNAKSVKTGKVKQSKASKVMSVDMFSIDTTTDDVPISKPTVSSDDGTDPFSHGSKSEKVTEMSFSYVTKPDKVIASSKTSKEAKAAVDVVSESEDNAPSSEASAKSGKIVAKVVRAMPTDSTTGAATNSINAAENGVSVENAAVVNGAGAFFVVLTFAVVGAMMA
eukprot:CAMPEP_0113386450 /NCGR_PEP_ID=MMETSP0013_2-20120614/8016_1 /TAXON_ID=2843 ORGANISM="Skeletonema costatum, Strain 1716" /NCGR_SAMPLE_ID=MMETSP0013_2 /ASSEMBLY_ACC=CAM_ASM_000158 /LENGTH=168 /DNA_ID=CAMNT_0000269293 /DNA_START=267 /DNA_END=773 /DNA_ORIENTATION=+ /assembly_acc=CAM_ASM_000158